MSGLNIGDALWQLFNIGLLVVIIVLIVFFIRSGIKRRKQLDRIEKKMDEIEMQIRKGND